MVRTENGKLIIEISLEDGETPAEKLIQLRETIHETIVEHDYNTWGSHAVSFLMAFAKELELSEKQIKI